MEKRLKLYGFNNLTKTLSFNIYDVCYAKTEREQKDYIAYIDEQYNSERLTNILCQVTEMIGASVLNISKQDYADLLALIDKAYGIIVQHSPPPREYNVARRLRLIGRKLEKRNAISH